MPAWFGRDSATAQYIAAVDANPTFVARDRGEAVGFLTVKVHHERSAEIYVMAVSPRLHRQGVGRALLERVEDWLRARGTAYLQVETLGPSPPDPSFSATRMFYDAVGFSPVILGPLGESVEMSPEYGGD